MENNKKNKDSQKKDTNKFTPLKIAVTGIGMTVLFFVVIVSLSKIIFIHGKEYGESAYNQQMKNKIISAKRGMIYDSNGNVLAKSVSVKTISINPGKVCYANGKAVDDDVIATGLAGNLGLDYNEVLGKVSSKSNVSVIAKKVDQSTADGLQKWLRDKNITTGVNIDEDTKRSYPYNDLASNLIGICGDDNSGIIGIEERWNNVLKGTSGKIVTMQDVKKNTISDETEQYIPVENGSNIYLTIDITIQQIVEKYLKQAVEQNSCAGGGNVIVMNPQNGEILAMATYPNYNLNQPFAIEPTGEAQFWDTYTSEQKNTAYNKLWMNKSVSKLYEPGSTFKIITASVALEENLVETDKAGDFLCTGSYQVEDYNIHCWRAQPHGYQSLREALCNSCNPAFMQLGQRIGATTLYKYYKAFGLFDTIGSDIAKTYKSVFHNLKNVGKVELATISFGQRFEISPLQLITAVSTVANNGVLVEPKIVKKVENADTGVVQIEPNKEIRQVISKETSEKVKDMMKSVVIDGTGKHAAVEGYTIGGKSGTSEPMSGNEDAGYVASFIAISPIENTQVVVLVVLYDPQGVSYQGGQTAGPVASNILKEVLPYFGIDKNDNNVTTTQNMTLSVPNLTSKTISSAKQILQTYGFETQVNISGDENNVQVIDQMPKPGTSLERGAKVYLYAQENDTRVSVKVPVVTGLTVQEAREKLKQSGLNIKIEGDEGMIISQEPQAEKSVEQGTVVDVVLEKKED